VLLLQVKAACGPLVWPHHLSEATLTATVIALFNHKGGVSKTTTTFNLGWMLAELGKRVIIVDADSQCNLTGMVLGYKGPVELETFYVNHPSQNLWAGLAPAFESQPRLMQGIDCLEVQGRPDLFLLPGHIGISEYEVTLGIAQELSGSIQTLQNLPGATRYLLSKTAEHMDADYVLVDMSPGLGSMNQNLLITSDFFIVPSSPDFFSLMAIDSLARVLPRWQAWGKRAHSLAELRDAVYPFPDPSAKFAGTILQRYRPRGGAPASAFQSWIDGIDAKVEENLLPVLAASGMLLEEGRYDALNLGHGRCLAQIPDFNSLIARSQEYQTPIYALSNEQIGQVGVVLDASVASRDSFHAVFKELAEKVLQLTSHAPTS
jgi:cellulose biosynthesis protein BcsQ